MSAVQPTILNAVESCRFLQNEYLNPCRYLCTDDGRFLYELCPYKNSVTVNDSYTGDFTTIISKKNYRADHFPRYYLENGDRVVFIGLKGREYHWTSLKFDPTFTSLTTKITPITDETNRILEGRWLNFNIQFVAANSSTLFVVLEHRLEESGQMVLYWYNVTTRATTPIGRVLTSFRRYGLKHQFHRGRIYFVYYDHASITDGISFIDLNPTTNTFDSNGLPILAMSKLNIKEIKPARHFFLNFVSKSDYLYITSYQQPGLPFDCCYLFVYNLLNDQYRTCLLRSSVAPIVEAMGVEDGILTIYTKKLSLLLNQQLLTSFRYTLNRPETLTALARRACPRRLKGICDRASLLRSRFVQQKHHFKRSASAHL
ncbi:hypothetical protein M3Y98_00388300 [Aphelenchoides besseyi]|nr:hypothetical protein M3Y98_00388300 [Aphelenchoides besseyi]